MNTENYLNHPTFGLFYRVCLLEEHQEVFHPLCAAPIFLVTTETTGLKFEPISRSEVRLLLEHRLRLLRRTGQSQDYDQLQGFCNDCSNDQLLIASPQFANTFQLQSS